MIPRWIIRNTLAAYGNCLEHVDKPKAAGGFAGHWTKVVNGKAVPGNLPGSEYELWKGSSLSAATYANCRLCAKLANSREERAAHIRGTMCAKEIRMIARLLLRDHKCVICDGKTHAKIYGFPICSQKCLADWRFDYGDSASFREAKKLVVR